MDKFVLKEVYGKPWDLDTIKIIKESAPSDIRIVESVGKTLYDAMDGRMTIYLDKDRNVDHIIQESW